MTLLEALTVHAHFYHITPLNPRETALLKAARALIRAHAEQVSLKKIELDYD